MTGESKFRGVIGDYDNVLELPAGDRTSHLRGHLQHVFLAAVTKHTHVT